MRLTELEKRLRGIAWPEPSADLRARVLTDAPVAGEPVVWRARVAKDPPGGMAVSPVASGWRWRRAAWLTALGAMVVVASCTGLDTLAGQQVEAEIARLEARYGSLALSTLTVPPVPPEDNRALVVKAAAAALTPPTLQWSSGFRVWVPMRGERRAFAEANQVAVRMASGVRSRRQSNWEVDYAGGKRFPEDEPIRALAEAISTTSLMQLDAGQADEASATIAVGLGVTASLRQEPDLLAQVVRASNLAQGQFLVVREIITRSEPSAPALDDLAAWLAENRSRDATLLATLSTVKQANAIFARMERGDIDSDLAKLIYPTDWIPVPSQFLGVAMRVGRPLVRRARLRFLQESGKRLTVLAAPFPHAPLPWWDHPERWNLLDRVMQTMTDKFTRNRIGVMNGDESMSSLAATELAVGLRRFKINRGEYPDDLSALVPLYLDHLPIDPLTGQPPVYARDGAGFTLRAKGWTEYSARWAALEWNVAR